MDNCEKHSACYMAITVSVVLITTACALWIRSRNDKKKLGGRQIRVNYKFSKEFDD